MLSREIVYHSEISEEAAVETRLDGVANWRSAVIPGNKQFKKSNTKKSSKCIFFQNNLEILPKSRAPAFVPVRLLGSPCGKG